MPDQPLPSPPAKQSLAKQIVTLVVGMAVLAAVLFGLAGRLDWLEAWAFLLLFFVYLLGIILWLARRDPALMAERRQAGPNVKGWDKIIMGLYTGLLVSLLIIACLDAGRFRWSSTPFFLRALGWGGLVTAGAIIVWTMASNTFLSESVRIQTERGHRTITAGPYRYVRHPMYVGVILCLVGMPCVLGSWWAMLPGFLSATLFVIRTALEDRTLQQELPGYREYARRVRYRLLPWVW
jgi:protein-S-isoprenylcysteine O-methyltransferase Ste14